MTLRNKCLSLLVFLFATFNIFSQENGEKDEKSKTFSEQYNTWAFGAGVSNFIMHGDLRSIGTLNQGSFVNFGAYFYIDKMFNPILGLEAKLDYSTIDAASQRFSQGYTVLESDGFNGEFFVDGVRYGGELNGIVNLTNLWKLNSTKWSTSFMVGMGYHRYTPILYGLGDNVNTPAVETGRLELFNWPEGSSGRPTNDDASSIFLNTSISVKYRLNKKLDIELRPSIGINNEDHLDGAISNKQVYETFFYTHLGIVYKFGAKEKYAIWIDDEDVAKNAQGESVDLTDTDEDGVIDQLDKEPETPKEAEVYGSGKAVDTDKDGIPDHLDQCILLAGPEANEGCPEDTDRDGVYDYDDVCPEEKGPAETLGCPKEGGLGGYGDISEDVSERIFLLSKSIYFKSNSDEIKDDSYSILNEIANIMVEYPNTKYKIDGHTDNRADNAYNMALSERRAESVLTYLRGMGVNFERLDAKGYGEEKPVHSNETVQGRKFNRRVEINFIDPNSEEGKKVYEEGVDVTKHLNIIKPLGENAIALDDSDKDGVADIFDQEADTPIGAKVYGNGISVDTDKDGIPDYSDNCPLKPGDADKNGCPDNIESTETSGNPVATTTIVEKNIDTKDTDGDGVIDIFDVENDTPNGAKVYGNGAAVDTDNDGIIDIDDPCPLKKGENGTGCPEAKEEETTVITKTIVESAPIKINDADGDGVLDELDIENNTPIGAKVYGNGVAIDTDYDGIIDLNDKCPIDPGKGTEDGCPTSSKITSQSGNTSIALNDQDGDGVIDGLDKEPNTPANAKVYGNGVSVDSDNDGVADHSDNCPLKYGSIEQDGCPLSEDSDGDGVINTYDKEPNTPFGVKVYGNGVAVDTDSDGTPDHKDACPLKPGEDINGGCPSNNTEANNNSAGTISLTDSDNDGVVDQFDKEPNTPKQAKVYGNGVAVDNDNDGIADYMDKCPFKSGEGSSDGCPNVIEETKQQQSQPQIELTDTDGDGVIDQFDRDPNTPTGAQVYGNGIPVDSDRDGLPDYLDNCPLKAGPVEQKGCPTEEAKLDWGDDDGDGVINQFDKEPNTLPNVRVYGNGVSVDSDYDDIPDHLDECPFDIGSPENKGCPVIEGAVEANMSDTDKDGVLDIHDEEPNTPFGVKVYSNGVSIDSDKDKVPDYKDRCPLIKGLEDNEGCPLEGDLDGDGVSDDDDLCPDVSGSPSNDGCPTENFDKSVSIQIENLARKIHFERTKNTLSNETMAVLDEIITIMQDYPATKYQIASHTDDKHNEKYSLFLSKRRANAILKYLVDGGVDEERLTAEGYGDTNPKYSNNGDAATSELNNRIEFNFILPD